MSRNVCAGWAERREALFSSSARWYDSLACRRVRLDLPGVRHLRAVHPRNSDVQVETMSIPQLFHWIRNSA
jgi:hypothetical protein